MASSFFQTVRIRNTKFYRDFDNLQKFPWRTFVNFRSDRLFLLELQRRLWKERRRKHWTISFGLNLRVRKFVKINSVACKTLITTRLKKKGVKVLALRYEKSICPTSQWSWWLFRREKKKKKQTVLIGSLETSGQYRPKLDSLPEFHKLLIFPKPSDRILNPLPRGPEQLSNPVGVYWNQTHNRALSKLTLYCRIEFGHVSAAIIIDDNVTYATAVTDSPRHTPQPPQLPPTAGWSIKSKLFSNMTHVNYIVYLTSAAVIECDVFIQITPMAANCVQRASKIAASLFDPTDSAAEEFSPYEDPEKAGSFVCRRQLQSTVIDSCQIINHIAGVSDRLCEPTSRRWRDAFNKPSW